MEVPGQQHLFDPAPYTRPATHSEPMVQAADTRTPAMRKRDANRDRIAMSPGSQVRYGDVLAEWHGDEEPDEPETRSMQHDYGIPYRANAPMFARLSPFDDTSWRKYGEVREMPLYGNTGRSGSFATGQPDVVAARVDELAANPHLGTDPRFGHAPDLPLVAPVTYGRGPAAETVDTLHNGNHRVAAAVQRGEMFTPVNYIPRERMGNAVAHARYREENYGLHGGIFHGARQMTANISAERMVRADPTFLGGKNHPDWDRRPWD